MKTKTIEITEITVDELADKVAGLLLKKIEHYLVELNNSRNDIFLTRHEAAAFLKVNLSTLWNWTTKGKIKSYGLGNRRYYNKKELVEVLQDNVFIY